MAVGPLPDIALGIVQNVPGSARELQNETIPFARPAAYHQPGRPDPECDLCHVPNQARAHKVRVAVSNSFGFGGSNTCLVLKAA